METENYQRIDIRRRAYAVIPDGERLGIGKNSVIAVFKLKSQAIEFAAKMWEQYYIIEEVDSEHFL